MRKQILYYFTIILSMFSVICFTVVIVLAIIPGMLALISEGLAREIEERY